MEKARGCSDNGLGGALEKPDNSALSELAAYSGDPWNPSNTYFDHAEKFMEESWEEIIQPVLEPVDFTRTVDLAAGHGRNSEYLKKYAKELYLLDIQPGNVEVCRERFAGDSRFRFATNNGYDLQPVPDVWATLVYCFDAMVHFDSDVVRSYLKDTLRVLEPGGFGFFHHSNYLGGFDWRENPNSRSFMSTEFFAHYADKEGLEVCRQQKLDWGGYAELDGLTLVRRPA